VARITSRSSDAARFAARFACEVKNFNPLDYIEKKKPAKMGAFIHYAIAASDEAVKGSGLKITDEIAENVGTYISSGIGDFWPSNGNTRNSLRMVRAASPLSLFVRHRQPRVRTGFRSAIRQGPIPPPRLPAQPGRTLSYSSRSFSVAMPMR